MWRHPGCLQYSAHLNFSDVRSTLHAHTHYIVHACMCFAPLDSTLVQWEVSRTPVTQQAAMVWRADASLCVWRRPGRSFAGVACVMCT
jgi:hypothetical protein